MAARRREKLFSIGLLPRMEARPWKNGKTVTYRYKHADGRNINLGTDKQRAILEVAKMGVELDGLGSLNNLWTLYQTSSYWLNLSDRTKSDYIEYSKPLLKVFGNVHIAAIRPTFIARYLRVERGSAPVRANRETALLSNLSQLAIDNGLIDVNPCKSVRRNTEKPRDTLPSDHALESLIQWLLSQTPQRQVVAHAAKFASLTGSRQIEFLPLRWEHIDGNTIKLKRAKQRYGKVVIDIIKITKSMEELLDNIKALKRESPYVFPNIMNGKYSTASFKGMWQECKRGAITDGIINKSDNFAFHDLRAYYATKHKIESGTLPDLHASPTTTAKVYERSKQSKRSSLK